MVTTELLEEMARELATSRNSTLPEARAAIRIEMVRLGMGFGVLSREEARARLARVGVVIRTEGDA